MGLCSFRITSSYFSTSFPVRLACDSSSCLLDSFRKTLRQENPTRADGLRAESRTLFRAFTAVSYSRFVTRLPSANVPSFPDILHPARSGLKRVTLYDVASLQNRDDDVSHCVTCKLTMKRICKPMCTNFYL